MHNVRRRVISPHVCPRCARVTMVHERGRLSWREEGRGGGGGEGGRLKKDREQAFLVSSLTILMWKYEC